MTCLLSLLYSSPNTNNFTQGALWICEIREKPKTKLSVNWSPLRTKEWFLNMHQLNTVRDFKNEHRFRLSITKNNDKKTRRKMSERLIIKSIELNSQIFVSIASLKLNLSPFCILQHDGVARRSPHHRNPGVPFMWNNYSHTIYSKLLWGNSRTLWVPKCMSELRSTV